MWEATMTMCYKIKIYTNSLDVKHNYEKVVKHEYKEEKLKILKSIFNLQLSQSPKRITSFATHQKKIHHKPSKNLAPSMEQKILSSMVECFMKREA